MAFLDNSGDIILDAVLTDLGRKRLAEGNFRITQFAFGDDEIDYGLYDKDHPSGSAYYDLEILQTPVFESFTRHNANINYGLASYNGNPELLYLPSMILNEKSPSGGAGFQNAQTNAGVVYYSVSDDTTSALGTAGRLGSTRILTRGLGQRILFETGLHTPIGTPENLGSSANQSSLIISQGLLDPNFIVSADNRLFSDIMPMSPSARLSLRNSSGESGYTMNLGLTGTYSSLAGGGQDIQNYGSVLSTAVATQVYSNDNDTASGVTDTSLSAINGPRGAFSAFAPRLISDFTSPPTRSSQYELYGKINQNLFGDGQLFDYIDTVIYVRGQTTGVTAQVVVRIIRKV